MKSTINLSIDIEHHDDIYPAQEFAKVVAGVVAAEIGLRDTVITGFGRITLVGAEDGQNVRVYLQSAAITRGA